MPVWHDIVFTLSSLGVKSEECKVLWITLIDESVQTPNDANDWFEWTDWKVEFAKMFQPQPGSKNSCLSGWLSS